MLASAVPTIAEEDAKRPNRERECLVKERTRLANRMKGALARLGIRNFKPTLRQAAERLATMHTPEGTPVPPNALAELQRDLARLGFVVGQIKQIEKARQKRLEQPESESGPQAMVRLLARVVGIVIETADVLPSVAQKARGLAPRAIPRRTRALPALASPCSRRRAPLSSGAPVKPAYRATTLRSRIRRVSTS